MRNGCEIIANIKLSMPQMVQINQLYVAVAGPRKQFFGPFQVCFCLLIFVFSVFNTAEFDQYFGLVYGVVIFDGFFEKRFQNGLRLVNFISLVQKTGVAEIAIIFNSVMILVLKQG